MNKENWKEEFDKKFNVIESNNGKDGKECFKDWYKDYEMNENMYGNYERESCIGLPEQIKEFIFKEKLQSYQQGRIEALEEVLKFVEDEAGKTGRREIINFINTLKLN